MKKNRLYFVQFVTGAKWHEVSRELYRRYKSQGYNTRVRVCLEVVE